MEIKTRFDVGDTIVAFDYTKMKAVEFEVCSVTCIQDDNGLRVYYSGTDDNMIDDKWCFASREDMTRAFGFVG